jgi:hypothetical protein
VLRWLGDPLDLTRRDVVSETARRGPRRGSTMLISSKQEGQVEQAELDPAAALLALGVHRTARPARGRTRGSRGLAGLHSSPDRAIHLERRLAASFQQRQPDRLVG